MGRKPFSSEGGVVHLESPGFQNPDVSRNYVTKLDFKDVSRGQFFSLESDFLPVAPDKGILGHQILEGLHDLRRFTLLVIGEDASDNHDSSQDNTKVQVIIWRLFKGRCLNGVGHKAEDGSTPKEHGEASKQVLAELDPLGRRLGRREGVGAVSF